MYAKVRVTMTMTDEMLARLDAFCGRVGVTRGGCVSMLLDERLPRWDPRDDYLPPDCCPDPDGGDWDLDAGYERA